MIHFLVFTVCFTSFLPLSTSDVIKPAVTVGDTKPRVYGLKRATEKQFPWYARLQIYKNCNNKPHPKGPSTCGGALISKEWILTAAHCFTIKSGCNLTRVIVNLGITTIKHDYITISAKNIVVHENYTIYTNGYDIALIELEHYVYFSDRIRPIPIRATPIPTGTPVTVCGFGRPYYGARGASRELKYAEMITVGNDKCLKLFKRIHFIPPSAFCTESKNKKEIPCKGDSGGPLVFYDSNKTAFLVGITSFGNVHKLKNGIHACTFEVPTVFTKTWFHLKWINSNTGVAAAAPLRLEDTKPVVLIL